MLFLENVKVTFIFVKIIYVTFCFKFITLHIIYKKNYRLILIHLLTLINISAYLLVIINNCFLLFYFLFIYFVCSHILNSIFIAFCFCFFLGFFFRLYGCKCMWISFKRKNVSTLCITKAIQIFPYYFSR